MAIEEAYVRKARGEEYYLGPECPPEVLRKLGLDQHGTPVSAPPSPDATPQAAQPASELEAPAMVVDDTVGRVSLSDEVEDEGFGDVSKELSVVADSTELGPGQSDRAGSHTVLVVDDEADIRKLLRRLLTTRGYRVLEADRGLLALRLSRSTRPISSS